MSIRYVTLHELTRHRALHPTDHPYDERDEQDRSENAADVHDDLR
jgi:hypothetical protein